VRWMRHRLNGGNSGSGRSSGKASAYAQPTCAMIPIAAFQPAPVPNPFLNLTAHVLDDPSSQITTRPRNGHTARTHKAERRKLLL
jgi:hypothetical protein